MTYDVVVVGAGPAGSTIAKIVAERGFKVLVLEKYTLDREKPCGGGITNRVVEHFKIPEKAFSRECTGIFLCSPKNMTVVIGKRSKIRLVMRSVFDKVLCQMAMDKGAEFSEKSLVNEPLIKNGKVIGVKTKINGKTKTNWYYEIHGFHEATSRHISSERSGKILAEASPSAPECYYWRSMTNAILLPVERRDGKVKSPLIVPYFVPYQHSLTMNLILRAKIIL